MSVGEVAAPSTLCTPIMSLPRVFHGDGVGTSETQGPFLGVESPPGSPSFVIIWRKSFCARLRGLECEVGGWRRRIVGWEKSSPCVWGLACVSTAAVILLCFGSAGGVVDVIEARNVASVAAPPTTVGI